ncbi:hypothetical protein [Pseudaestuariivita rosea]|uniref:hypothetical protein n=1 Tax=Pseudaestuariivita rosea TaxID=2763263 RepID=UPI001ABA1590|nr:hypothetical protein [Pseudaestuariivita rosea]
MDDKKILKLIEAIRLIELGKHSSVGSVDLLGSKFRKSYLNNVFGYEEVIFFELWHDENPENPISIFPANRNFAMTEDGRYIELEPMGGSYPAENSVVKQLDMTNLV